MSSLLTGVRVIECATLRNGDNVGMLLGDLGADVIKVEAPARGDHLRLIGGQITPQHSRPHVQFNRNKRSVTIDLRREEGRDIFWRLHATADVFVDGYIAGACDRLGIGYAEQRARRPSIVYAQHSGFGADSPYADIPTHGQMMDALAARFPTYTDDDGLVRRVPPGIQATGTSSGGDPTFVGALYTVQYVLAALLRRSSTGAGARIDVAGADAAVTGASTILANELNAHRVPQVDATADIVDGENVSARYQFYACRDEKVVMFCAIEATFWRNFARAVGEPGLLDAEIDGRQVDFGNDPALRRRVAAIFRTRDLADWVALARTHDIPIGPAYRSVEELRQDEHFQRRAVLFDGTHPHAGPFTYIGTPAVIDGDSDRDVVRRPAPVLGEHTDEVLAELGYDVGVIAALRREKVVSA